MGALVLPIATEVCTFVQIWNKAEVVIYDRDWFLRRAEFRLMPCIGSPYTIALRYRAGITVFSQKKPMRQRLS
jgi:hypothetical protein